MLPVPYDQALSQIYSYQHNNPPVVPAIQVHPEGAQLLITAAALSANAVGEAAMTTYPRLFCYNMMQLNNWQNQDFYDLVRLVVDYTVFKKLTASSSNIHVTLQQSATDLASLYAANIASRFPEFFMLLDEVTKQRINQNLVMFNDYVAKADSVYSMHARVAPMASGVMNMGYQHQRQPHPMQNMHSAQHTHHTPHGNMGRFTAAHPAAGALVTSTYSQKKNDFVATKFATVPRSKVAVVNSETPNSTIQGDTMDRSLHQIAYRSRVVTVANKNPKPIRKQEEEKPVEQLVEPLDLSKLKDITAVQEINLQTAFETIDSHIVDVVKYKTPEILTYSVSVISPVISNCHTGTLFAALREARTLANVADAMIAYKNTLLSKDTSEDIRYFGLIWLGKLDKAMTDWVNQFFLNSMPEAGFKISGIMEDGPEIQNYVSTTYKTRANPLFNTWQRNLVMGMFSMNRDSGVLPDITVNYEILTTKHFVAAITATSEELDYGFEKRTITITQESSTMFDMLYQINKLAKQEQACKNWIYTLDGKKWVFWETADSNAFKVYEE